MLAPAVLSMLLASSSLTAPCLAQQLPPMPPPLIGNDDFDHTAFWEKLKQEWHPPEEGLREPQGPMPKPLHPHLAKRAMAGRAMQMSRLYRPWGDGFVRMNMQRQVFNETNGGGRRPRAGRIRRPNKSTYPANNGDVGGVAPNATTVNDTAAAAPGAVQPTEVLEHSGGETAAAGARRRRRAIPNSDVQQVNAKPAEVASEQSSIKDKCKVCPEKPGWSWSHLDDYLGAAYMVQLEIGNPFQQVRVSVDTGSYELWVNPKCVGSADPVLCGALGHYYPQLSTSAVKMDGQFKVVYGTGAASGVYYADWVRAGSFTVPVVQFAVADDTNYTYSGVLGLGYSYPFTTKYPTLLSMMWALGFVAAPAFSIGLGGDGDGFSEIIFGGVNRWKFTGPLEPIPIWPPIDKQDPTWLQYWVNLTSVGMTFPGPIVRRTYTSDNFVMPMLIDSGSTLSYIREDVVAVIGKQLNAQVDADNFYWVDCKLRSQNGTIDFGFNRGRMMITVRYKDFIWEQTRGRCLMGFQPADQGSTNYVLGDTFLRGAYVVFDQQVDVVWMADYYNCGDGVQMIREDPASTQYIVGQC